MSNRICKRCKSTKVVEFGYYGGTTYYRCEICHHLGEKDEFPEVTVFDRITASPEVLAPNFVVEVIAEYLTAKFVTGYRSTIIPGKIWEYESEAIAATVARLEELEK